MDATAQVLAKVSKKIVHDCLSMITATRCLSYRI